MLKTYIARFSPVMQQVINHAQQGKFVIGICNGFQVLTEAGLLPGALARNQDLHFICDRSPLKVERNNLPWTQGYTEGEIITLPIAHGEGRFYSDETTLAEIEANGQVLFRYQENPNGSLNNIAGICNLQGNVLGMMPHPERAADKALGNSDGYERNGTANIFMFTEPLSGWCKTVVSARRTAVDWATGIKHLLDNDYPDSDKVILIFNIVRLQKSQR